MDAALADARELLALLERIDVRWVCITAGSPYYNPHVQRPALFPPTDGYQPPEDPLVGVARQIDATARLKKAFPNLAIVGSAYTYLQDWLPNVAQHVVRHDLADFVGLGRMVLSYPDLPADVLAGRPLSAEARLPDVPRLHDRPQATAGFGLLPARPVLQVPRTSRSPKPAEVSRASMTNAACRMQTDGQ